MKWWQEILLSLVAPLVLLGGLALAALIIYLVFTPLAIFVCHHALDCKVQPTWDWPWR